MKRRFWGDLRWQISKRHWYVVYSMTLGTLTCRLIGHSKKHVPAIGACARCLH